MKIQTETTIPISHFVHTTDDKSPCRRLHGHNVRVVVEIDGEIEDDGMIVDFRKIKEYIQQFDHKVLVPQHLAKQCVYCKDNFQIVHNKKWYSLPLSDVALLSIDSMTSENFAKYIWANIQSLFFDKQPRWLKVTVYETPTSFAIAEG